MKAIETRYAGCRFRSRLEAKHAVFFDHLGLRWEYEPQGYRFAGHAYLPDFLVHSSSERKYWIEVKGETPTDGYTTMLGEFAEATEIDLFLTIGDIPRPEHVGTEFGMQMFDAYGGWDEMYQWARCPRCGSIEPQFAGRAERNRCDCLDQSVDEVATARDPKILDAYAAARSARFEHGESGASR